MKEKEKEKKEPRGRKSLSFSEMIWKQGIVSENPSNRQLWGKSSLKKSQQRKLYQRQGSIFKSVCNIMYHLRCFPLILEGIATFLYYGESSFRAISSFQNAKKQETVLSDL